MPKLFFASDLHLHHPNILFYEPVRVEALSRYLLEKDGIAYDDEMIAESKLCIEEAMKDKKSEAFEYYLTEHDNMLIDNWNKVVGDEDTVIFLGDFAYCHRASHRDNKFDKLSEEIKEKIVELGNRLKGHKIMIMGNHDWRGTYTQGPMIGMHRCKPEVKELWLKAGFEEVYPNAQVFKEYFECSHEPSPYYSPSMVRFNLYGHVHSDPRFQTETENSFCACIDRHNLTPIQYKKFNDFIPDPEWNI